MMPAESHQTLPEFEDAYACLQSRIVDDKLFAFFKNNFNLGMELPTFYHSYITKFLQTFDVAIENHKGNVNLIKILKLYQIVYGYCIKFDSSILLKHSNLHSSILLNVMKNISQINVICTAAQCYATLSISFNKPKQLDCFFLATTPLAKLNQNLQDLMLKYIFTSSHHTSNTQYLISFDDIENKILANKNDCADLDHIYSILDSYMIYIHKIVVFINTFLDYRLTVPLNMSIPITKLLQTFTQLGTQLNYLNTKSSGSNRISLEVIRNMGILHLNLLNNFDEANTDLILPYYISTILPILNSLIKLLHNNAIPYISTIVKEVLIPCVEFFNRSKMHHFVNKNEEISNLRYTQFCQNRHNEFALSLLGTFNITLIILGPHIEFPQHSGHALQTFFIKLLSQFKIDNTSKLNLCETNLPIVTKTLLVAQSIFSSLNNNYIENNGLQQKIFALLTSASFKVNVLQNLDSNIKLFYLQCLTAYLDNHPSISKHIRDEVAQMLIHCKRSRQIELSTFATVQLEKLDALIHPKMPFMPRFMEQEDSFTLDFYGQPNKNECVGKGSDSESELEKEEDTLNGNQLSQALSEKNIELDNKTFRAPTDEKVTESTNDYSFSHVLQNICNPNSLPLPAAKDPQLQQVMDMLVCESSSSETDTDECAIIDE